MSSTPLKVEITRDLASNRLTVLGTPEQQEIMAMEYQVRDAVIRLLADQFIKEYGHQVLNDISPKLIADELRKAVAKRLYE